MANIWKQFEDLLQKDATQVAEVVSVNPNSVTVELLSGDRLNIVSGGIETAAGDIVFFRKNQIIQKVSALPRFNMILY